MSTSDATTEPNSTGSTQEVIEVERKFTFNEESEETIKKMGGTLLQNKTFCDIYYDTNDYKLTINNYWLRQRDGCWQLKCPPKQSTDFKGSCSTQYAEYEVEHEIKPLVAEVLQLPPPESITLADFISASSCNAFATFKTERKSYALDDLTVDLDSTDFGFKVGEIEALAANPSRVPDALSRIDELAKKLGFELLDTSLPDMLSQQLSES